MSRQRWEDGRAGLIKIIENENPQGSVNNQLTILFDGRPGRVDTPGTIRVKVTFTGDQSADDRIKEIVTDAQNKKSYVVVTDDRDIQYYVRSLGAKVLKVADFLSHSKSHQDKTRSSLENPGDQHAAQGIPQNVKEAINTELEKIWLRKKKS